MNLNEVTNLITIKEYIFNCVNGHTPINRASVTTLNNLIVLLDKKILNILQGDEFKQYVDFADLKETVKEIRKLNDIKSGLK